MPALASTIAITMTASVHSPVATDAAAAKTSRSSSGLFNWFQRTPSRVKPSKSPMALRPMLCSRPAASDDDRPSAVEESCTATSPAASDQ